MRDGPLRIVASQEITGVGTCVSDPVVVDWHWYYNAATAAPWALIALLLVVPKANRNRQAWLILIPPVAVLIVWRGLALLLGVSVASEQQTSCLVMSAAMAWTAVWLLGHWLRSRYSTVRFFSILAVMAGVGALSLFCSGAGDDSSMPLVAFAVYYGLVVVGLVAAMMLAGRFCRKRFSGLRFGLWLLLWIEVVTVGVPMLIFLGVFGWMAIAEGPSARFAGGLIVIPVMMAMLAGIVYVFNLPFLIVGTRSTLYRRRLEGMFRGSPKPDVSATATSPFAACVETERMAPVTDAGPTSL